MLRLLMIFLFFAYVCCEIKCIAKVIPKSTTRPGPQTTSVTTLATTTLETIITSLEIPELGKDLSKELKKFDETECFNELKNWVCSRISLSINFFRFIPKSLYLISCLDYFKRYE